jgi:hypothetical protein
MVRSSFVPQGFFDKHRKGRVKRIFQEAGRGYGNKSFTTQIE